VELKNNISAADILGNPKYLAISYGGFRQTSRDIEPTIGVKRRYENIVSNGNQDH
jgi:hypothetical protein